MCFQSNVFAYTLQVTLFLPGGSPFNLKQVILKSISMDGELIFLCHIGLQLQNYVAWIAYAHSHTMPSSSRDIN